MPVSSPPTFSPAVPPIALGAAGTVLTSNGVATAPTFQAAAGGGAGRLLGYHVLTGAGTYTPTAGTTALFVRGKGPGGGSGGVDGNVVVNGAASCGAGSGAMAEKYVTSVPASVAFNCGTPGAGGAAGNNPGAAGTTATFGAILSIPGGNPSTGDNGSGASQPGDRTALPTGGDVNIPGQAGDFTIFDPASGNPVSAGFGATGGELGAPALPPTVNTPGSAGASLGFGAGGSGSASGDATNYAGAAGAPGVFFVWEYS